MKNRRYCIPCDRWVGAREYVCKQCGADTDKAAPEDDRDEDYERAQRPDAWEEKHGGGL